jgi:hypothetical protein
MGIWEVEAMGDAHEYSIIGNSGRSGQETKFVESSFVRPHDLQWVYRKRCRRSYSCKTASHCPNRWICRTTYPAPRKLVW